jgi:putative ABC transport system permease protein
MNAVDGLRRSGRNLRHAKARTILTILAIAVGALALCLTLAAGVGARQFTNRLVGTNFNPHTLYVYKQASVNATSLGVDTPQPYDSEEDTGPNEGYLTGTDLQTIAGVKNVASVEPIVTVTPTYIFGPNGKKYGVQVRSIAQGLQYQPAVGTMPTTLSGNQVIMPEAFVSVLGFKSDAVAIGQSITINYLNNANVSMNQVYTIVAVAKDPNGLVGGADGIILSQEAMQQAYNYQTGQQGASEQYDAAIVYVNNDSATNMLTVQLSIEGVGAYSALTSKDLAQQVIQVINIIQYAVAGFGALALVVSIFGIVNTQLISVLERTREIGLMKALGMSGRAVLGLFTLEAAWIGLGGAAVGVGLAYIIGEALNPWVNKKLQLGGNLFIYTPLEVGALVIGLMVIAALAGLAPAWKASQLNPIEALRTE